MARSRHLCWATRSRSIGGGGVMQNRMSSVVAFVVAAVAVAISVAPSVARAAAYQFVDLAQASWWDSTAFGVDGGQQVGQAQIGGPYHAMLWSGTSASATDLTPAGYHSSVASEVNGGWQVGAYGA